MVVEPGRAKMVSGAQRRQPPLDEGFDHLFNTEYPRVLNLAYRVLGDRLESEDVTQEAFLRLSEDPEILSLPSEQSGAWLRRVAVNLAINRRRDAQRQRERQLKVARLESRGEPASPVAIVLDAERREAVRVALTHLPERQQLCLLLRHSGYSYAEIAETAGVALGSVGVLLARAERAFREHYQESPKS
jgi:RNA polymerase sigma factor (sigma-70 family)